MAMEMKMLDAVESQLRATILAIVKRRQPQCPQLTWRAMFEIEEEAMSLLHQECRLREDYLAMMGAPAATDQHARNDEPVTLNDLSRMHTTLWMIQEAYYHGS
jgi:hypothetical protein